MTFSTRSQSRSFAPIALLSVFAALGLFGCSAAGSESTESATDESVADQESLLSAPDEDYISTPVGKLHKTCIHEDDGRDAPLAPCRYKSKLNPALSSASATPAPNGVQAPTINGWIENSRLSAPAATPWFGKAISSWQVPNVPRTNAGQLLYWFPGFQNTVGTVSIIQPVLQWGNNGSFGGNFYTIASWYVTADGVGVHSAPVTVASGDLIDGTMTSSNCSAAGSCTWSIVTKVHNGGAAKTTTLVRTPGVIYNWAAPAALEAYNVTACQQFPAANGLNMTTDLYLKTSAIKSTLAWGSTVNPVTPNCGFAVINNPNPGMTRLQVLN